MITGLSRYHDNLIYHIGTLLLIYCVPDIFIVIMLYISPGFYMLYIILGIYLIFLFSDLLYNSPLVNIFDYSGMLTESSGTLFMHLACFDLQTPKCLIYDFKSYVSYYLL